MLGLATHHSGPVGSHGTWDSLVLLLPAGAEGDTASGTEGHPGGHHLTWLEGKMKKSPSVITNYQSLETQPRFSLSMPTPASSLGESPSALAEE